MIDTITLYKQGRNLEDFTLNFKQFQNKNTSRKTGQINYIYDNFQFDSKDKRNIYIKYDLNRSFVLVNFSVPKLINGNSLKTVKIKDKDNSIQQLHKRLENILDADFENMEVSRLDVSRNIKLENEVPFCLSALKQSYDITKGRYRFKDFSKANEYETLEIKNKSRVHRLYDKVKESISKKEVTRQEAKEYGNILRFENEHKKSQYIKTSFPNYYKNGSRLYISELFTEQKFKDFKEFQLKTFNLFFLNSGQYEMFINDISMLDLIFKHSHRSIGKNFLTKKYVESGDYNEQMFKDLLSPYYTRQGLNKVIKEIRTIKKLGKSKVVDIIEEIRTKLVA